jgi:hypothetical protein
MKNGVVLIVYDEENKRHRIPALVNTPTGFEYPAPSQKGLFPEFKTFHGKNRTGPDFGRWGKPEAAELWKAYKKQEKES